MPFIAKCKCIKVSYWFRDKTKRVSDAYAQAENIKGVVMNKLNPKKLLNSKWTAIPAINKEKHFIIVEVEFDEDGNVIECITEAVMSKNQYPIQWRDLKDEQRWRQGWK